MTASHRQTRSRAKILAAGEEMFLSRGYVGTSMDAVTEAAGVSKQTVYAHFVSKQALFLAVIAHTVGGATSDLQKRVGMPAPGQSLADWLTAFAHEDLATVMTPRLMQLRRLVIGEQSRFPEIARELYARGAAASIARLSEAFDVFVARGEMIETDTARAADLFNWSLMGGPTSEAMLLGDEALLSNERQAAHVADCVAMFLARFGR